MTLVSRECNIMYACVCVSCIRCEHEQWVIWETSHRFSCYVNLHVVKPYPLNSTVTYEGCLGTLLFSEKG